MPTKTDATGKRWVEMEFVTPGTPEQVWQAMAGEGNAAWFVPMTIEGKVGGAMRIDMGQGNISNAIVTAWEPPIHFGYVEPDWSKGAPPCGTEITITPRAGGQQCAVRMTHALFTASDQWDESLEMFESGWSGFFEVIKVYLANFPGKPAASFNVMSGASGEHLEAWTKLTSEIGLAGANVGERRTTTSGPERWIGIVERVHQDARMRFILLRLEGSSPGVAVLGLFVAGGATNVSVARYFYGDDAEKLRAAAEPQWREWFKATFEVPKS